MTFSDPGTGSDGAPLPEINMVPLIDVMLVLLVIFIITAPLLTHAVKVDLPKASSQVNQTRPDNIQIGIDRNGVVFWNGEIVDESALRSRMRAVAGQNTAPELHLRADGEVAYRNVARVMADAAKHGLTRIGFVTDPSDRK
jgi:biopolymer transport protein ExbD